MIEKLADNTLISLFFTIIGLILAIIGIYLTMKYKRKRKFDINKYTNSVILNKPKMLKDELKILHKGFEIDGLNILEIVFENTGTEVLTMKDFYQKPLIKFNSNVEIISFEIEADKKYIKPKLSLKKPGMRVKFNFIEAGDFIKARILYSAKTIKYGTITFKVIDGNELKYVFRTEKEYQAYRQGKSAGKSIYMIIAVLIFIVWQVLINKLSAVMVLPAFMNIILPIFGFIIAVIIAMFIGTRIQDSIHKKQLRAFLEKGELDEGDIHPLLTQMKEKTKN